MVTIEIIQFDEKLIPSLSQLQPPYIVGASNDKYDVGKIYQDKQTGERLFIVRKATKEEFIKCRGFDPTLDYEPPTFYFEVSTD